jgi:hypothetical protein
MMPGSMSAAADVLSGLTRLERISLNNVGLEGPLTCDWLGKRWGGRTGGGGLCMFMLLLMHIMVSAPHSFIMLFHY